MGRGHLRTLGALRGPQASSLSKSDGCLAPKQSPYLNSFHTDIVKQLKQKNRIIKVEKKLPGHFIKRNNQQQSEIYIIYSYQN